MVTVPGSIRVDSIMANKNPLNGKSNLANPYPTKVLDMTVSSTLGTTSRNVFFIKCPMLYTPPPDFQPSI